MGAVLLAVEQGRIWLAVRREGRARGGECLAQQPFGGRNSRSRKPGQRAVLDKGAGLNTICHQRHA